MTSIPESLTDLLERPLFGALATVRPDDTPQVSPMWFDVEDGTLRFTHTTKRAKFRNLARNPAMAFTIFDPNDPLHHIEVRGKLVEVIEDPTGSYYVHLGQRYGDPEQQPPPDSADRVVLVMSIDSVNGR